MLYRGEEYFFLHGSTRIPQKCGSHKTLTQSYGAAYHFCFAAHSEAVAFFKNLPALSASMQALFRLC